MPGKYFYFEKLILSVLLTIILSACGGGGGSNSGSGITSGNNPFESGEMISGTATAPGGSVASLEYRRGYLNLAYEFVIKPAYAAIIGLEPVSGVTVELIQIDDDGNPVGDVLATAVTANDGGYTLELPVNLELSADLIVRISGTGISMSAMVVDNNVDINPVSQFILEKFVENDTLTLSDISVDVIIEFRGRVEEFDFIAEVDLSSMLDRLEDELGDLAETEIAEIERTPDDGTATADRVGNWNRVEFNVGFTDSEDETFGTLSFELLSSNLSIEAGSTTGTLSIITNDVISNSLSTLSVDNQNIADLFFTDNALHEEDDDFEVEIDADGNLSVTHSEEIDLLTDESDLAGPDSGIKFPSLTRLFDATADGNGLVSTSRESGDRFETTDTDGNGIRDALNLDARIGDETAVNFHMLLRAGEEMNVSDLDGYYGFVTLLSEASKSEIIPVTVYSSSVGKAHFDGTGEASVPPEGINEIGFERLPFAMNDVAIEVFNGVDGGFGLPYSMSPIGSVILETDNVLQGWTNKSGSLIALLDVTPVFEGDNVIRVFNEILIGLKLPVESVPMLNGAKFNLYPLIVGASENGTTEILTFGRSSNLRFDDSGAVVTTDLIFRGFDRDTDVATIFPLSLEEQEMQFEVGAVDGMGKINFSHFDDNSETHIKGFVSADGNHMILRVYRVEEQENPEGFNDHFYILGFIFAVRQ